MTARLAILAALLLPAAALGAQIGPAYLQVPQTFSAGQGVAPVTLTISGSTFTPDLHASNNFNVTLVHASCPCTLANPVNLSAGERGVIVISQSSTGSDTIGTWGAAYKFAGGVAPTLSTAAGAIDLVSFYVIDSTHIAVTFVGALQ